MSQNFHLNQILTGLLYSLCLQFHCDDCNGYSCHCLFQQWACTLIMPFLKGMHTFIHLFEQPLFISHIHTSYFLPTSIIPVTAYVLQYTYFIFNPMYIVAHIDFNNKKVYCNILYSIHTFYCSNTSYPVYIKKSF